MKFLGRPLEAGLVALTLACFLAYAVVSGLITEIDVVSGPLAEHFDVALTDASARMGFLGTGILIGTLASLVAFEALSLKQAFVLCYLTAATALGLGALVNDYDALPVFLLIAGAGAGLGLCTAAVCLALLFDAHHRATALLATDLCFALTGALIPTLAAAFIGAGMRWDASYLVVAAVAAVILLLMLPARFPLTAKEADMPLSAERPPLGAWLCGAGLFLVLLGQASMQLWLPSWMEASFDAPLAAGAEAISGFWTGMAAGQAALVGLLAFAPLRIWLIGTLAIAVIASAAVWNAGGAADVPQRMLLLGVANAGILKLTISAASEMLSHPQRIVSALLAAAALGTALGPFLSSALVEANGPLSALQFSTACQFGTLACIAPVLWRTGTRD